MKIADITPGAVYRTNDYRLTTYVEAVDTVKVDLTVRRGRDGRKVQAQTTRVRVRNLYDDTGQPVSEQFDVVESRALLTEVAPSLEAFQADRAAARAARMVKRWWRREMDRRARAVAADLTHLLGEGVSFNGDRITLDLYTAETLATNLREYG